MQDQACAVNAKPIVHYSSNSPEPDAPRVDPVSNHNKSWRLILARALGLREFVESIRGMQTSRYDAALQRQHDFKASLRFEEWGRGEHVTGVEVGRLEGAVGLRALEDQAARLLGLAELSGSMTARPMSISFATRWGWS